MVFEKDTRLSLFLIVFSAPFEGHNVPPSFGCDLTLPSTVLGALFEGLGEEGK